MDLIKKSASVIENEYKRVFMRFLKELNLQRYWKEYIQTEEYRRFVIYYLSEHPTKTALWYDRETCAQILGMCNFPSYLDKKKLPSCLKADEIYKLYIIFLSIFCEEEYSKYIIANGIHWTAETYIEKSYQKYGLNFRRIVEEWKNFNSII